MVRARIASGVLLLLLIGLAGCQGPSSNLSRSKATALISAHLMKNPQTSKFTFHEPERAGKLYPELVQVAPFFSAGCYAVTAGSLKSLQHERYAGLQEAGLIWGLVVVEGTAYSAGLWEGSNYYHRIIVPSTHEGQVVGPHRLGLLDRWDAIAYFLLTDKAAPYVHEGSADSTSVKVSIARVTRVEVTGIVLKDKGSAEVEATVEYELTPFGKVLSPDFQTRQDKRFPLTLYDDGWRVQGQ